MSKIKIGPYDESIYEDFGEQPSVLEIQLGYSLLPIAEENQENNVLSEITKCRNQVDSEYGLQLPPVRIRDNVLLEPSEYRILLHGTEVAHFKGLLPGQYMCLDTGDVSEVLSGDFIQVKDPAFGIEGFIIDESKKDEAVARGYSCSNIQNVIRVHLFEIIKEHITEFLNQSMVNTLINKVRPSNPDVIDNIFFENGFQTSNMKKILNLLLEEHVSIKDMNTILETIADNIEKTEEPLALAEKIRQKNANQILSKLADTDKTVHVILVSKGLSCSLFDKVIPYDDGIHEHLDLAPIERKELTEKTSEIVKEMISKELIPVFLCESKLRKSFADYLSNFYDAHCISDLEALVAEKVFNIKIEGELL